MEARIRDRVVPEAETARATLSVLGEIELRRGGEPLPLPPSKKTRALLAYLALTGRPHRRERLCDLLWDLPDDPRGALRWSLSKLRPLVDEPGRVRLVADRETVALDLGGLEVDLLALRAGCARDIEQAPLAALEAAAARFRGELLEGLDLQGAPGFHAWCIAEREEARVLRARILGELARRLEGRPDEALPYARTLVDLDPLDVAARAALIGLLAAAGRLREAEGQYEAGLRLAREHDTGGIDTLHRAWREAGRKRAVQPTPPPAEPSPPAGEPPLVGREAEMGRLLAELDAVAAGELRVVLLGGEPGVGKSRLLGELARRVSERGGTVLSGTAYEAETGRPYGPWIDAGLPLPESDEGDAGGGRARLFGAVVERLADLARRAPPVLLVLDDLQWCDEASAALLHHVLRMIRGQRLLVVLAASEGELAENPAVQRVVHALAREVTRIELAPLGEAATARLLATLAPAADAGSVYTDSGGNPLFVLELGRALQAGDTAPRGLAELVQARIHRLSPESREVLLWCAVLAPTFDVGMLEPLAGGDLAGLSAALDSLERHALLRADAGGTGAYAFAYDLVRRLVYAGLSEPRRRLMHLRVARLLQERAEPGRAGELVRHAALAGDDGLAADACVAAGERCLRLFANDEADGLARRGLEHAARLPEPERTRRRLELLRVAFAAHRPEDSAAAAGELAELAERALDHGCLEHARIGFHTLAYLRWEEGDWSEARRQMLQAELVGRSAAGRERIEALAEAALCLALLERDLSAAEALLLEAGALAQRQGIEPAALALATGMLRAHRGAFDEAVTLLERARALARGEGGRTKEFQALEQLVLLELDLGRDAESLASELVRLGDRLREGSEAPFARALHALTRCARGLAAACADLDEAIEGLRVADAKHRLAAALNRAALVDLGRGRARRAAERAEEALALARLLDHASETATALSTLARVAAEEGDVAAEERLRGELASGDWRQAAMPVRRAAERLLAERGAAPPRALGA
jgi:predicted ATPase/DNA-binding SARP family transcriptional activator